MVRIAYFTNMVLGVAVIAFAVLGWATERRVVDAAIAGFAGAPGDRIAAFSYVDARDGQDRAIDWSRRSASVLAGWPVGEDGAATESPLAALEAAYHPSDVAFVYLVPLRRSEAEVWARRNAERLRPGAVFAADGARLFLRIFALDGSPDIYVLDSTGRIVVRSSPAAAVLEDSRVRAVLDSLIAAR
ncbi:MAG TPA: hypothetical protein VNZ57_00415 [Longimicrobiales bacterium]|nr:hypothetical protein [Longimicrobiales bacterium]